MSYRRLFRSANQLTEIGKANILLVDDHLENLLALEAMLEDLGQNLVKASSGEEALLRVLDMEIAVILLDVQMPSMDGFEVARIIRERDRSQNTPIIFLTAIHRLEENIFQGYEVGAVDYLFKPLIPEILRAKVKIMVKQWQQTWEIKRQAEYLERANLEQERQLRELKHLTRELETLNRELEGITYIVSHELRDPLRRINSYAVALSENYLGKYDGEGQVYLQQISALCMHMGQLMDDIVALSYVTRAKLDTKIVNLTAITTQIADQYRTAAPERNIKFVIQNGLYVNGDEHLLTILMEYLVGNAWKHARDHDKACIEVGVASGESKHLVYYVRDDRVGFDMEYPQEFLGAFQHLQADSDFEGIGLAASRQIVQRHGGRIWVESKPEQGTTFYFTL